MDISSITSYDIALITANFTYLTSEDFRCREVEKEYKKRVDHENVIRNFRKERGCFKMETEAVVEIENLRFYSCLCHPNFKHPIMNELLSVYTLYKKGIMPFSGGSLEQPAQIMEFMGLIDNLQNEYEADLNRKHIESMKRIGK